MSDSVDIIGRISVDDQGTIKVEKFNSSLLKTGAAAKTAHGAMGLFGSAASGVGKILQYAFGGILTDVLERASQAVTSFAASIPEAGMNAQKVQAQLDAVYASTKSAFGDKQAFTSYGDQLKQAQAQLAVMEKAMHKNGEASGYTADMIEAQKERIDGLNQSITQLGAKAGTFTTLKGQVQISEEAVKKLGDALSSTTMYSDQTVNSTSALLLTFTSIGKDVFPDALKATLDMSQALGQDTKSSAIQLGKALQDPILGMTALRRVGVNFNEESKKTVEALVKQGKLEEAQKFILHELTTEFGGSAEAAGKTFAGQMAIANNQVEKMKEKIGLGLLPIFTNLLGTLNDNVMPALGTFSDGITQALGSIGKGDFSGAFDSLSSTVKNVFGADAGNMFDGLKQAFMNLQPLIAAFIVGMGNAHDIIGGLSNVLYALHLDNLGDGIVSITNAIQTSLPMIRQFAQDMIQFLGNAIQQVGAYLGPNLGTILQQAATLWETHGRDIMAIVNFAFRLIVTTIGGALTLVTGLVEAAFTLIQGLFDVGTAIMNGRWDTAWNLIQITAKTIMTEIGGALTAFFNLALSIVGTNLDQFTAVWSNNWDMAKKIVSTVFDEIVGIIKHQIETWFSLGEQLVQGIWNGINANFGQMMHDLQFKFQQVSELAKTILGIHSPSTVFQDIGKNIVQGLTKGTRDRFATESPSKIFAAIGSDVMKGFQAGLIGSSGLPLNTMLGLADQLTLRTAQAVSNSNSVNNARYFNFYLNGDTTQPPSWFNQAGINQLTNLANSV